MKNNFEIKEVSLDDPIYPENLKNTKNPPKKIYYKGKIENPPPLISIVGTRKATPTSLKMAEEFACELSESGFIIVSGLALGIDSSAHRGALLSNGKTWAVLGNGIDEIYPKQNERLSEDILESEGCIISEYPPKTPSYKNQFVARNRIIAGLSSATIVIEAPKKSGALFTAEFSKKEGREVFVVPGAINQKNFEGSNDLIKNGAKLITSVADILKYLGVEANKNSEKHKREIDNLSDTEKKIVKTIREHNIPVSVDKIAQIARIEIQETLSSISILTIKGIITEEGNGFYSIKK